jgi:hypothetical protein
MQREKSKGTHLKDESTDAGHRDGGICSSEETVVMTAEQRDSVILTLGIGQPIKTGGINEQRETVRDFETPGHGSFYIGESQ